MVEDVAGSVVNDRVPSPVDVGAQVKKHVLLIVYVHLLIDDDDHLRKHHLPRAPNAADDIAGLHRVFLSDLHEGAIVERPKPRERIIDDCRDEGLQQGKEDSLGGLAQIVVLLGRLADDGRGVNRALAMGDGGDAKFGVPIGQ